MFSPGCVGASRWRPPGPRQGPRSLSCRNGASRTHGRDSQARGCWTEGPVSCGEVPRVHTPRPAGSRGVAGVLGPGALGAQQSSWGEGFTAPKTLVPRLCRPSMVTFLWLGRNLGAGPVPPRLLPAPRLQLLARSREFRGLPRPPTASSETALLPGARGRGRLSWAPSCSATAPSPFRPGLPLSRVPPPRLLPRRPGLHSRPRPGRWFEAPPATALTSGPSLGPCAWPRVQAGPLPTGATCRGACWRAGP